MCLRCYHFFGYSISAPVVRHLESNVKATTLDLSEPQNTKELVSCLGTTNFCPTFVPNYAQLADPLRLLLCKDEPWVWTGAQSAAFASLKQKIVLPLCVFPPGERKCSIPVKMSCDLSNSNVNGISYSNIGTILQDAYTEYSTLVCLVYMLKV